MSPLHPDIPLSRDLVLIGGGHTHALVLRRWGMNPLPGARVTVINPAVTAPYTGMLPGYIAGHYRREDLDIDLMRLAGFAGARLVLDEATGIDLAARRVHLKSRPAIRYDVASINVGVTSEVPGLPGFDRFGTSAKPLGNFAAAWESFLTDVVASGRKADCIVMGGGVAGVELALAMAHRLRSINARSPTVTVVEVRTGLLEGTGASARGLLLRKLARFGVTRVPGTHLAKIQADHVRLGDGRVLPADFVVSAAGARPHAWLSETALDLTDGYVDVGPTLRSRSDASIFATGDCANLTYAPRPKAGVFAVREAPILFDNLRAALAGVDVAREYHPQRDYLKLISSGDKTAVAEKFGLALSGPMLWKMKDSIDRSFMDSLSDLPPMVETEPPKDRAARDGADEPDRILCGGCGSKVTRQSLDAGLASLLAPGRSDTVRGYGDDAAVVRIGGALQVISTDHLRAFSADDYTMATIAAVHALGDVWAMGAAPQSALVSLVIPHMSERMQADTVSEIMAAIAEVLRAAGADLVGGHTSMGRETTIGLTVTGLVAGRVIGLEGAGPGDVVILTKPIGTGVILAADMRRLAPGSQVEGALRSMRRPVGCASKILSPVAHAMTDVTGFGLAGHLMNILESSNVRARINLNDVPILEGAEAMAARDIRSSIWAANARLGSRMTYTASARSDLLFDPQTAGGLLAAVPAGDAVRVMAALVDAGDEAAVIGWIEEGEPAIIVV